MDEVLKENIVSLLKDFKIFWKEKQKDDNFPNIEDSKLASMIDHTLLKPEATSEQVQKLCAEAKENNFASVCVNSSYIPLCDDELRNTDVKVCSVIGFPLGAVITDVKEVETSISIALGANEVDMVINVGALKENDFEYVRNDIKAVVDVAVEKGAVCKVIIETSLLSDEEKVAACLISKLAGAHFVKTSTGFAGGGATERDVALMKFVVGEDLKVKASGGIRNRKDALNMIKAGAERLGTSSGIQIINEAKNR